jgi:asparagine synthase (glutamine-hydrolysing)
MCGIVGLINRDGSPVDFSLLASMAETIRHRGPDEEGHFIENNVGFYHKRLSIIDLVSGRQPISDGPASIIFNGEIYNYIELREALKKRGYTFVTNSDTEVILKLYLEYGPECVRFLNGMYAFLIYDRKLNQIVAARDHFGIKPLYYAVHDRCLILASEIKAILAHPSVIADPNYEAIQEYLIFQYVLSPETLFRGIQKLLPGHYLIIDLKTFEIRSIKYWEPDFTVDTENTEEFFSHRLRELLEDSVRIQLRSDVPLGTHLSGGTDSSVITALAARQSDQKLKSFTGAFRDGPQFDETPYAREVASFCGTQIFEVFPTEAEFIDLLPRLIYFMDEPAAGPGLFPQYMVARLASREVKVTLGGQGGDEIFGGYTRYVIAYLEQALKGAIFETNDEGEHIVSLTSILPNLPFIRDYVPMLRRFLQSGLFDPMDRRYFHLIDRTTGDQDFLTEDFRKTFERGRIFSLFQNTFNNPNTLSYYNKMVNFDLRANLPALLQVEDRVSMAVSLESRVPFLDYRIVELVARMPPAVKFRGAEMKYILKKAAQDILPQRILERKDKMGFPVPLHLWARNRLRGFIQDILLSPACRDRGLFNPDYVRTLVDREEEFGRRLWGLLNLELWFNTFIDGNAAKRT